MGEEPKRAAGRVAGRKIRVSDVAQLAGVSPSTVDRVLNDRPGVRPDTLKRVEEAMISLGYVANALTARIQSRPTSIEVMLPAGTNPFYAALHEAFDSHAHRLANLGARLVIGAVDVFDSQAVSAALRAIEARPGRCTVIVAQDAPETRQAIDDLIMRGVPVITLVSDSTRSARAGFVGIDNFAAGRTAGFLMARLVGARSGRVDVLVGHLGLRDHLDRRSGFEQAMAEYRPDCEVRLIGASHDDDAKAALIVRNALNSETNLVGFYNVGAAHNGVFSALRQLASPQDLTVICHELNEFSRPALLDGTCDALITQDVTEMARRAVELAVAAAQDSTERGPDTPMPIGIMVKENLPWLSNS